MPKGARRLPDECLRLASESDLIIHLGDFSRRSVFDDLARLGPPIEAVHGNVDEPELRRLLPAELEVEFGGARLALLHDAGPSRGRLERLRRRFPEADTVLFGHSHLPLLERKGPFQIFNPGSPTERRRAPRRSMGLARVERGELRFEHVWLEAPG